MCKKVSLSIVLGLCCMPQFLFAVVISNPEYQVETYLTYDTSKLGMVRDFTFDSNGNIYVTHTFDDTKRNGSVQKISPDKTVSPLCSNLVDPRQVEWGGGTQFGDYLYVSDRQETANYGYYGEITKIDLQGNKTPFCGGVNQPDPIEIDRTGNYNNLLYIGNSAYDKTLKVDSFGGSASVFSPFPNNSPGSPFDIAFDTTGSYMGGMFVSVYCGDNYSGGGLFRLDQNGIESRYADFHSASDIAFDDTMGQDFAGAMYVAARHVAETKWTLYKVNGSYDTEIFGTFDISPIWLAANIEFGPDGAMYVMEWDQANSDVVISRITPIPEPASLLLIGLGGLIVRRKK